MAYIMRNGRWADTEHVTLYATGVHASGAGPIVELGDRSVLRLTLAVAFVAPDSRVTVRLETAETADGPWRPAGAFTEHTEPVRERVVFAAMDRWVRAACDVEGQVAFGLAGEAV